MDRLTYRGENGKPYVRADGYYHHCRINLDSIAERLAEYEDAEEQGLLVRLPCKVGDTVYIIMNGSIYESEVYHITYSDYYGHVTTTVWTKCGVGASFHEFGESAFLTREEAEAAPKGEREDV